MFIIGGYDSRLRLVSSVFRLSLEDRRVKKEVSNLARKDTFTFIQNFKRDTKGKQYFLSTGGNLHIYNGTKWIVIMCFVREKYMKKNMEYTTGLYPVMDLSKNDHLFDEF